MDITIDEATKELERETMSRGVDEINKHHRAENLGLEALKRIQAARAGPYYGTLALLLGESKE